MSKNPLDVFFDMAGIIENETEEAAVFRQKLQVRIPSLSVVLLDDTLLTSSSERSVLLEKRCEGTKIGL